MKLKNKDGMDKSYRHILSLVLSLIMLVADTVTTESKVETFDDLIVAIMVFFVAGLIYYVLVRIVVEALNFIGKQI